MKSRIKISVLVTAVLLGAFPAAFAQSYTLIDLSPDAGNGVATTLSGGAAAGYVAGGIYGTLARATVWTDTATVDLHPAGLENPTTGNPGRSYILGSSGNLQVGSAAGPSTGNRLAPMLWRGTAETASFLTIPFTNFGGQAQATDGQQIVGYGIGLDRDGTTQGPSHAVVWDATTGAATDLGGDGNGAIAYGVGGGTQVGVVYKALANAALWRGSRGSLVLLHPKNAVVSIANGTDGARQVGYAGFDIRVRQEAAKGNKDQRFNYAFAWSGSSASGVNIHPYPVNAQPGVNLTQSYALGVNGGWIVGYAGDATKSGTPAYSHAIVWGADYSSYDLNVHLPAGFVGAQAVAVDAEGNVSGFIAKSDGTRHAAVWVRTQLP